MFPRSGQFNWKLNRESRRIYNISGMPSYGRLIYSGSNSFPVFPIQEDGSGVYRAGQLDSWTTSAGPIRTYKYSTRTDTFGSGYRVEAMGCAPQPHDSPGRKESMNAGMRSDAADYCAAGLRYRSAAVMGYDED